MAHPIPTRDLYAIFDVPDHARELRGDDLRASRHRTINDELDRDYAIIGWGMAFAYLWVCAFRVGQMWGAF